MDRAIPNLLVEPIRHEFSLNDAQLGVLTGLAFAVAYSLAVLPLGWISDRARRPTVLAVVLLVWSLCTTLGGFARSFPQLLLARFAVGAAEAGAVPVAMPMISDIFRPEQRGTALGVLFTSTSFGLFLAGAVGGYVTQEYGWRAAFLWAGLPGVAMAIVVWATVKEPRRGGNEAPLADDREDKPTLADTTAFLMRSPGLVCLTLGCAFFGMTTVTIWAWIGSFFIRVHQLDIKHAGLMLGLAGGIGQLLSPVLLGYVGDRLRKHDLRLPLVMLAGAALLCFASGLIMVFTASTALALVMLVCHDLLKSYAPTAYAVILNHAPARLRGSVMAIVQLTCNLLAFGVGPVLAGTLSDYFGGDTAIRYGIALVLCLLLLTAALFLVAVRLLYPARSLRPAVVTQNG
jgi:predicted MFS family arabinose efflux permease